MQTYLSKLILDPGHPQARRDLADAYEMHRTLVRAFVPNAEASPPRFLWRLEPCAGMGASATVLVQADVPADWHVHQSMPGYAAEILGNKVFDLEKLLQVGGNYRFRLKANPTVTRAGKRHGLTTEAEQMDWLNRQGVQSGFTVLACLRGSSERIRARQGGSGRTITVHGVLMEGMLEVQDAARLSQAVRNGLGHAKALGLGLLSLARVR